MARARRHPIVNTRLAEAVRQAGWSMAATAKAVNQVGWESGLRLSHDATAIAHWLTGTIPRPQAIPVIVETFSRRLAREMTADELGWPGVPAGPPGPWQGDPVAVLAAVGEDDMLNRRTALTTGLYSLAALTVPDTAAWTAPRPGEARRAGAGDVQRIREMTRRLADADDAYGGGHARATVAAYLARDVVPLLAGRTGRDRPALFAAAAEVAYLAGWMAADAGAAGLSQRYYVQALRLGEEAGDPMVGATVLRSMAAQAVELGHPAQALALADAAAERLRRGSPARTRAWVSGMRAEASAVTGDRRQALDLLRAAEQDLERADSVPWSQWTGNYRRSSLEHQIGLTLAALGDLPTAERHLTASAASRGPAEQRARALIGTRLAHIQIRRGLPHASAHTILALRQDLAVVSSARVAGHLRDLRVAWQPCRAEPEVAQADRLAAGLLR